MTEPSVTIIAKCSNGHETFMFPDKCVRVYEFVKDRELIQCIEAHVEWECPICKLGEHCYGVRIA
jgi:hypothetical protein